MNSRHITPLAFSAISASSAVKGFGCGLVLSKLRSKVGYRAPHGASNQEEWQPGIPSGILIAPPAPSLPVSWNLGAADAGF